MSQSTDITLGSNLTGTNFRTELNDIIAAFGTTHSGTSAPSYKTAGMLWMDTSGGATAWILKMYDGTDWISVGTFNTTANTFTAINAQQQDGSTNYAADAGSNDTYAITLSPVPSAYTTGMVVNFKANTANTGEATLNVNSLGAKTLKRPNGQDLQTGDILANKIITTVYDGTNFVCIGGLQNSAAVNAQTGTTYTVVTGDRGCLVTYTNASAIAVTLPQAGSGFEAGWYSWHENRGAGTVTITPTTSTIDGASSITLPTNQGCLIFSDGTNYYTFRGRVPTAAQADMETGTSTTLYPTIGMLKYFPCIPKAVAFCTVSGGVLTTQWSFGMTGVTRSATGKYYATASTAFSATTAYHGLVTGDMPLIVACDETFQSKTTSIFPWSFRNNSNLYTDPTMFFVALFGDQ